MSRAMVWGASGGIGSALVHELVEDRWMVIGVTRDPTSVAVPPYQAVQADVADEASVRLAVK